MDIGYIANHTIKPSFVAGQNYEATIVEATDKESGFTLELMFEELRTPAFWHFNVAKEGTAKRIADDELKGLTDQIGEPITDSAQLVGKAVTVRLTSQSDSNLPAVGLPIAKRKGASLAI